MSMSRDFEHTKIAGILEETHLSWGIEHLDAHQGSFGDVGQPADEACLVLVSSLGDRRDAGECFDTVDHDTVANVLVRVIVHHLGCRYYIREKYEREKGINQNHPCSFNSNCRETSFIYN